MALLGRWAMPHSYRLTLYDNGLIDRMLPFEALSVGDAMTFAEGNRHGRDAVLCDRAGMVKVYPSDAVQAATDRQGRPDGAA